MRRCPYGVGQLEGPVHYLLKCKFYVAMGGRGKWIMPLFKKTGPHVSYTSAAMKFAEAFAPYYRIRNQHLSFHLREIKLLALLAVKKDSKM